MFRGDPEDVRGPGSVCIVANDFDYVMRNGGIGTYNWLMAHLLAEQGWRVHVLYCGDVRDRAEMRAVADRLAAAGIGWSALDEFLPPPEVCVRGVMDILNTEVSDRVRHALTELHAEHRFDLIEFAEWGGMAFRTVQARRTGLAFADARIAVKLHSSSQWMREGNHQWLAASAELEVDYYERYAFENADVQLSPTRYMLDYARGIGWKVRPDALVVPLAYPPARFLPPEGSAPRPAEELVFFGRLETRKGLEVFVEAVKKLDPGVPVTFLGRVNVVGQGSASQYLEKELPDRPFKLISNYNREQALRYLGAGNRLAVIASLADNSPYTVIECASNGIPFVASRVGGIPELIPDPEIQQHLLFEPNPRDLLRCLNAYRQSDPAETARVRQRLRRVAGVAEANRRVVATYADLLHTPPRETPATESADALVTVVVPYHNLPEHLPATLESLDRQSYPRLDVVVIDDGSAEPEAVAVFAEQRRRFPRFRFLTQENAGIGATRNRGLREARGEYFVCVDADNVARPDMVERMVEAMRLNPDAGALTCFHLAFAEDEDLRTEDYLYAYRPIGGPRVLGSIKNVYGDANAIFRTEAFRSVGGFETDRDTSFEDWEAFVKLVHAGHRVDVIPDYLFYYRHLEAGFSRVTKYYLNRQRVLRQFYRGPELPRSEQMGLWMALTSLQQNNEALHARLYSLRYRIVDRIHDVLFRPAPRFKRHMKRLLETGGGCWNTVAGLFRRQEVQPRVTRTTRTNNQARSAGEAADPGPKRQRGPASSSV